MANKNQVAYTDEFREQVAKLAIGGKPVSQIVKEYGIAKATVSVWVAKYQTSGSFRDADEAVKKQS